MSDTSSLDSVAPSAARTRENIEKRAARLFTTPAQKQAFENYIVRLEALDYADVYEWTRNLMVVFARFVYEAGISADWFYLISEGVRWECFPNGNGYDVAGPFPVDSLQAV